MRLRGIGPEVLLLCFLVIGIAAFLLGRRSARARRVRHDIDYFTGLDHLVNDRYDRAAEVFTRLATKSHEAEIQFALGSLMRRRGEVDRAIAIHTELRQHAEVGIREQATFALGLDYMSAGLFDRAEERLRDLLASPGYRAAALEKLAWLHEQQHDWRAALDIWRELPPEQQRERAPVAAHYCCELGEAALAAAISRPRGTRWPRRACTILQVRGRRCSRRASRLPQAKTTRPSTFTRRLSIRPAHCRPRSRTKRTSCSEIAQPSSMHACRLIHPYEATLPLEPARFRCEQCGVSSVTWHWRCPGCRS